MGVAVPVVAHGAALGDLGGVLLRQIQLALFRHRRLTQQLHGVDGLADVAAAGRGDLERHVLLPVQGELAPLFFNAQCPQDRRLRLFRCHRLEFKHRAAGQQGAVHVKIGILRGGGDQRQLAVLHEFQQALLLLFIEILNLIQIQQHPARGQQSPNVGHDVLYILQGRRGGVQTVQGLVGLFRDDIGNGGLAGAGGTVEHHIGVGPALNQPSEYSAGSQQVALSHHFLQCFGTYLIRQGTAHGPPSFRVKIPCLTLYFTISVPQLPWFFLWPFAEVYGILSARGEAYEIQGRCQADH